MLKAPLDLVVVIDESYRLLGGEVYRLGLIVSPEPYVCRPDAVQAVPPSGSALWYTAADLVGR